MTRRLLGRQARPATPAWNLTKTLFQMSIFWLLFLGVLPALFYLVESAARLDAWRFAGWNGRVVGAVLFALASCLGVSSAYVMAVLGLGTPLPIDCVSSRVKTSHSFAG